MRSLQTESTDQFGTEVPGVSGAVAGWSADPSVSLGARLRAARERRAISVATIAEQTKILGALLEGLERDDVTRWPTGFYRRAFIRAYAAAIGLDPDPVVREFMARFPDPEEVVTAVSPAPPVLSVQPRAVLRLTLAETGRSVTSSDPLREMRRRLAAVAADIAVLGAIGAGLYLAIGQFWAPITIAIVAYYLGGILVLGNTPGVCLVCQVPMRGSAAQASTGTEHRP